MKQLGVIIFGSVRFGFLKKNQFFPVWLGFSVWLGFFPVWLGFFCFFQFGFCSVFSLSDL